MSTFGEAILNPGVGIRFYVKVGGIGHIFIDGEKPTNPDTGVAWAAPVSKSVATYALTENAIDVGVGVVDNGPEVSRRTSQVSPSRVTVVFNEDRAGTMLDLFATELTSGLQARVTDVVHYDTTGAGAVIGVDSVAGWSTGLAYIGRETINVPAIDAGLPSLGTSGSKCARGLFELTDDSGNSYGDTRINTNPDRPGFTIASDFPRVWHNRWLSITAFLVDHDGNALGTAYDDDTTREVFRGLIQGNPTPLDDWQRWQVAVTSIEKVLDTEVGAEFPKGALMRFPGSASQNSAGGLLPSDEAGWTESQSWGHFVVTESTRYISCVVKEYATVADFKSGTVHAIYNFTGDEKIAIISAGVKTHAAVEKAVKDELAAAINADTTDDLSFGLYRTGSGKSGPYSMYANDNGTTCYQLQFFWDASGSIGPLLGYVGSGTLDSLNPPDGVDVWMTATELPGGVYIPKDALQVPFYYTDSEGVQLETAPASGFAKIGKSEIVKYTSITTDATLPPGIKLLNVSKRGALGTQKKAHRFEVEADWTTQADEVEVVFGMGFEDTSPLEAILQLAVSTGESAHHTAHDVLAAGISPPVNPMHFDVGQIVEKSEQMCGLQSQVNWFTAKSHKLTDLVSGWLQPFGLYLCAFTNPDGEYVIQAVEALPPLESEASTVVGTAHIDIEDPAQHIGGIDKIVNQLIVKYRYDMLEDEQSDDTVTVNDLDSQREFGVKGRLEWELRGFGFDVGTVIPQVTQWAYECFTRYARPYDLFKINTDRSGWNIRPGDVLDLTLPGAPTNTGVRGYTNKQCVVLQVSHTYSAPAGGVGVVGSQVVAIVERHTRQSTYSPSARVTSKSGSDVVVAAHDFTASDANTDASHFAGGDVVYIHNAGDWSSGEQKTIRSISGSTITLDSALSLTVGAATYMSAAAYGSSQSSQRKHVFISNNSTPPVLSASDTESYTYV